jgi:hypothetical protein
VGGGSRRVDGYMVIYHENSRISIGLCSFDFYDIGGLRRHMAFCAALSEVGDILRIGDSAKIMIGDRVTTLTTLGIADVIAALVAMGVVTGRAIHIAHLKTFTGSKQGHLIAVNVGPVGRHMGRHYEM